MALLWKGPTFSSGAMALAGSPDAPTNAATVLLYWSRVMRLRRVSPTSRAPFFAAQAVAMASGSFSSGVSGVTGVSGPPESTVSVSIIPSPFVSYPSMLPSPSESMPTGP
jgi:hypothetical protein